MTRDEYIKLCHELWEHNRRYYDECKPAISDYEFDILMQKLIDFEKENPDWVEPASPTKRVGESLTEGFKSVVHKYPMLSLPNTYSDDEVMEFIQRVKKNLATQDVEFCAELKMDGTAISVIYENGLLARAATRGNGAKGDDVTHNVRTIRELPLKLSVPNPPPIIEVRGEVYLDLKSFDELNRARDEDGLPIWANPRNAAAGSLKLLNPKEAQARRLRIVFYALAQGPLEEIKTQHEIHSFLKSLELPVLKDYKLCRNEKEIWSFRDKIQSQRDVLPFEIDGIVLKVNSLKKQEQLGATAKIPRWASAYKFAPEQGITKITKIVVNVGRTGALTPLAHLNPVKVAGSTISKVTLHNQDEIERKDIRIGDTVVIEKGGDVIPKVVSVILKERAPSSRPWEMPLNCPSCDSPVHKIEGEVAYRCLNELCPEKNYRHLTYFVSKEAMDIEFLGVKVIQQLIDRGLIGKPSDIYRLTKADVATLDGFKEKSINKLLQSIEGSKQVSLGRFIMALDIRYVGKTLAEDLAFKCQDIWDLSQKSVQDLTAIEGVGEKVALSIYEYFLEKEHLAEIHNLLNLGVSPQKPQQTIDHSFKGKTFVLTGTLSQFSRDEASALIKERGGKVTSSVSKKTDFLLLGESPGSKYDKAKKLNVSMLSESDFAKLL